MNSRNLPVSTFPGLAFSMRSRDLNSSPHAYKARTLLTESCLYEPRGSYLAFYVASELQLRFLMYRPQTLYRLELSPSSLWPFTRRTDSFHDDHLSKGPVSKYCYTRVKISAHKLGGGTSIQPLLKRVKGKLGS